MFDLLIKVKVKMPSINRAYFIAFKFYMDKKL